MVRRYASWNSALVERAGPWTMRAKFGAVENVTAPRGSVAFPSGAVFLARR